MIDGDWRGAVVLCAANPFDGSGFADPLLARHLCRRMPVLYVDPPISRMTRLRQPLAAGTLAEPRLRVVAPGLARLTPVVLPGPLRPGMTGLTSFLVRRAVRRAVGSMGASVRAVIATRPLVSTLGMWDEALDVYWAQDDYAGGAAMLGQSRRRLERGEARLAAAADVIVTSSPAVADTWRGRGREPRLIPFGCEPEPYLNVESAPLPGDVTLPPPIAGLIGRIADRVEFRLLEAVACKGHSLLLVGPRHPGLPHEAIQALDRLLALPNVQWVGAKPFDELASYLRLIDVGLVPYTRSPFNLASFPLKTLEYLAAGRPVVATDLPATRWLATDLIEVASEPDAFAYAVSKALEQPRRPELVERRQAFAAKHSWSRRAREWADVLSAPSSAAQPATSGRRRPTWT